MMRKWIPLWAREEWVSLRETLVDGWRYQRTTCSDDRLAPSGLASERHEARLTMGYHSVEKSLSLPDPRRPFGLALRPRLVRLLSETPSSTDEHPYRVHAADALGALDHWNAGGPIDDGVSPPLDPPIRPLPHEALSFFFRSRRSVRNFDASRPPSQEEIAAAVELARNTPSVCNRQGYRAHVYLDRNLIRRILQIQNGATGFSAQTGGRSECSVVEQLRSWQCKE